MSYILEALKRSQKERELGQVPTLADTPYLAADKPGRGAYWGIVAVALAVLATLIALYAAFGQHFFPVEGPSPSRPATTGAATAPDPGPASPAPDPAAAAPKVADSRNSEPQPAELPKPARAPAAPAVSTVVPDSGQRPESHPAPTPVPVKPAAPPTRTVVNKPAVAVHREPGLRLPPDTPEVPPELVREVQRFKEQVRQEQSKNIRQAGKPASAAPPAAPPTPVAPRPEPATTEEPAGKVEVPPTPRQIRTPPPNNLSDLPASVQQTIPEYRLTVHVYSSTPEQRFVIINSRKMREGDRSRKGLRLEEITPDGAMLEYQGQRFFHHR